MQPDKGHAQEALPRRQGPFQEVLKGIVENHRVIGGGIGDGKIDGLIQRAEGMAFTALAEKLGLPQDQVISIGESVVAKMQAGQAQKQAVAEAAAESGIDPSQVASVIPVLSEHLGVDGAGGLMKELNGMADQGGVMGTISGFLDRDGDGNPINDVVGMAQALFTRK